MVARISTRRKKIKIPANQPLKQSFEKLLNADTRKAIEKLVASLDKSAIPVFERSGNQKYVFFDSDKEPYTNFFTRDGQTKTTIKTDGKYTTTSVLGDSGGEVVENYSVEKYNYIIIEHRRKGKLASKPIIVTKDYRIKLYMQHLLKMSLG
jgi:hypothetical protein